MIRAIRHCGGQTGPDQCDTSYETKDFNCPELERFITWNDVARKPMLYGFVGLEIRPDPTSPEFGEVTT
jgi:hypothetical protein